MTVAMLAKFNPSRSFLPIGGILTGICVLRSRKADWGIRLTLG
jgi:hypothetical protein